MTARKRSKAAKRRAGFGRAALALCLALGAAGAAPPDKPPQSPAAGDAPQAGSAIGLDTQFFRSDEPIEITADRLDVDQVNKRAVFGGNVNAVQGDVHLVGQILTVFYDEEGEGGTAAPAADSPASSDIAASGGRIQRMEVTGDVHVSSPSEIATGDEGVYDLEAGTIVLLGNVILTRGENVLHGSRLNIDVDSGKSFLVGSEDNGRVKGLFVPKGRTTDNQDATVGAP